MTAGVGYYLGQCTGAVTRPSFRARARALRQSRSQRSHCAAFAAKDERVGRLRDFFETESTESSLIGQDNEIETEAGGGRWIDVTAVVPPVERGGRREAPSEAPSEVVTEVVTEAVTEARTNESSRKDAQVELKSSMPGLRPSKSAPFPDIIKVRLGGLDLANPRNAALRTLASYEAQIRERLDRFAPISVSLPSSESLPVPAVVRGLALDGRYRAPAAIGATALLTVVRVMAMAKKRRAAAVLEEKQIAIRERRGEKQRERFRQMFAGEDGMDASVFSAVRQKGENAIGEAGDAAASRSTEELLEDDEVYLDASMDEEIKKAYKDFVKNSKLGEGEFWNIEDEVEEFEKIEIDFDREDDE